MNCDANSSGVVLTDNDDVRLIMQKFESALIQCLDEISRRQQFKVERRRDCIYMEIVTTFRVPFGK